MPDKELIIEILHQILKSCITISKRFEPINNPDDFISSDIGLEKLDAISMQLIAIGESLKNLDKITSHSLLYKYPKFEWKKAKGMRDIISHHYFDLSCEIVFDVCENEIQKLKKAIEDILLFEFGIEKE